ncbi:MAG: hypothetical protein H6815_10180 [Phycisphaeraceae bacterium]|nr:hypothetical protein [Phycisphaerales bacterium]MCB9860806.1 hypothetical protein [Phycisphaeraceae bacterium]
MRTRTLTDWADLLTHTAGQAGHELVGMRTQPEADRIAWINAYRDHYQHRRSTDGPVLAHVLKVSQSVDQSGAASVTVWEALAANNENLISRAVVDVCDLALREKPLTQGFDTDPIEQWTERELAVLHAVTTIAIQRRDESVLARLYRAACWHVREIQPDNATNIPWACHTFAYASCVAQQMKNEEMTTTAAMHVETILHNAVVSSMDAHGLIDHRAAALLIDAAESLHMLSASVR